MGMRCLSVTQWIEESDALMVWVENGLTHIQAEERGELKLFDFTPCALLLFFLLHHVGFSWGVCAPEWFKRITFAVHFGCFFWTSECVSVLLIESHRILLKLSLSSNIILNPCLLFRTKIRWYSNSHKWYSLSCASSWGHGLSSHWSQEKKKEGKKKPSAIHHEATSNFWSPLWNISSRHLMPVQIVYCGAAARTWIHAGPIHDKKLPLLTSEEQLSDFPLLRTQAPLSASLSGLIYSAHIFLCPLLYVPSCLCLCLLEASRCPGLLVRGATGGYRRSGVRVFCLLCGSLGYRCAQGQSPTDRLGLRRRQQEGTCVLI